MELSFALINSQNFRSMTKELITFLETVSGKKWHSLYISATKLFNNTQLLMILLHKLYLGMIQFLFTEAEFKSSCSSGMLSAVEKYAPGPGKKCAIDTLFEVLRAAG